MKFTFIQPISNVNWHSIHLFSCSPNSNPAFIYPNSLIHSHTRWYIHWASTWIWNILDFYYYNNGIVVRVSLSVSPCLSLVIYVHCAWLTDNGTIYFFAHSISFHLFLLIWHILIFCCLYAAYHSFYHRKGPMPESGKVSRNFSRHRHQQRQHQQQVSREVKEGRSTNYPSTNQWANNLF